MASTISSMRLCYVCSITILMRILAWYLRPWKVTPKRKTMTTPVLTMALSHPPSNSSDRSRAPSRIRRAHPSWAMVSPPYYSLPRSSSHSLRTSRCLSG